MQATANFSGRNGPTTDLTIWFGEIKWHYLPELDEFLNLTAGGPWD
jgi:hypothetical protein